MNRSIFYFCFLLCLMTSSDLISQTLYLNTNGGNVTSSNLYRINLQNCSLDSITEFRASDISFDTLGNLYSAGSSRIRRIDTITGEIIGASTINNQAINGLTTSFENKLYSISAYGKIHEYDLNTNQEDSITTFPTTYGGDLTFIQDTIFYSDNSVIHRYNINDKVILDSIELLNISGLNYGLSSIWHNCEFKIYITESNNSITRILQLDLESQNHLEVCTVPFTVNGIAFKNEYLSSQDMDILLENCSTSLMDFEDHAFKLYPNPTIDLIRVENTRKQIEIFSSSGKLLNTISGSISKTIDMSDFPSGLYFIKSGKYIEKIIKI